MTGTCRPKNSPGVCTQASRTSSRNVHAKIQIYDLWLSLDFCTSTCNGALNIGGLNFTCLFQRAEIQVNKYKWGKLSTKAEFFPGGIYCEIHSPIATLEVVCIMALTLQPIRGCPQHSGETGTRLSSTIHRCLSSRFFFWRRGDVCTKAI